MRNGECGMVRMRMAGVSLTDSEFRNPNSAFTLARYANRQSDGAQTSVIVCGFDSHPCYLHMAQWTSGCGRHALTVEIAGSNPAWVTSRVGVHW